MVVNESAGGAGGDVVQTRSPGWYGRTGVTVTVTVAGAVAAAGSAAAWEAGIAARAHRPHATTSDARFLHTSTPSDRWRGTT
jgi:hypothetical protein